MISVATCAAAAATFSVAADKPALAEPANAQSPVALSPVAAEASDVIYKCFDAPSFAYADAAGLIVCGKTQTELTVGETETSVKRDIRADKIARRVERGDYAELIVALYDGRLSLYSGDSPAVALEYDGATVDGIVDFTVAGDTLYAVTSTTLYTVALAQTDFDAQTATCVTLTPVARPTVAATAVATLNDTVYIATYSAFGNKDDICSVDENGNVATALMQSDKILSLTAESGAEDKLFTLTRDRVTAHAQAAGGGLVPERSTDGATFTTLHAYGGHVYALDSLNAVHKLTADLATDKTLYASSSDINGFFDMPYGVAVKSSKMYVADTLNERVVVYSDTIDCIDRKFAMPVSVACDSSGTVYVAYEYNKIGVFRSGIFEIANERTISDPKLGNISQIVVNADKTLYALTSTGLWSVDNGDDTPQQISSVRYKALTLGVGRDKLYALADNAVYKISNDGATEYCPAPADAVSLAVDLNGSVFMLTPDGITRYQIREGAAKTENFPFTLNGESYSLGGNAGALVLCTVQNGFVDYGDAVIVDTYKHRIFTVDGDKLGARLIDGSFVPPDVDDGTPQAHGDGLIRTALGDTEVFSLPMETEPIYTISRGRNVIVAQYAPEEAREYALILIDDLENGKLVQGYVYKDALSAPLPYSPPPSPTGAVFNAATPVYKYPSRNAKPVRDYAAVDGNTRFALLDFVQSYRDDYGYLWYRVELENGCEGFILAINISTSNYDPVFIRPAYNAEIISYKGSTFAVGYLLDDGTYTEIAQLPTGTQLEVVGAFDSSKQYTEVKYVDAERGTLTCYVETVYIKYNGVNIVLLVAIVVIIVTVILASIIIARVMHNKKKNIQDEKDE